MLPIRKTAISKSWIIISLKMPPEQGNVVRRWHARITRGDNPHLRRANLAGFNRGLHAHEMRIETPVKPDHQSCAGFRDNRQAVANPLRVEINRLSQKPPCQHLSKQFDLLGMKVCRRAENDGIDVFGTSNRIYVAGSLRRSDWQRTSQRPLAGRRSRQELSSFCC